MDPLCLIVIVLIWPRVGIGTLLTCGVAFFEAQGTSGIIGLSCIIYDMLNSVRNRGGHICGYGNLFIVVEISFLALSTVLSLYIKQAPCSRSSWRLGE